MYQYIFSAVIQDVFFLSKNGNEYKKKKYLKNDLIIRMYKINKKLISDIKKKKLDILFFGKKFKYLFYEFLSCIYIGKILFQSK